MNDYYIEIDFGPNISLGGYVIAACTPSEALIVAILRVPDEFRDKIKKIYFV